MRRFLFILVLSLVASLPARAGGPEIEYAYPDQSVWTAELDAQGNPANPLLKVAKVLFAEAGIPWHGVPYPASRMFNRIKTGASQFSMLVPAPALTECCLTGKAPVAHTELKVFWLGDVPPIRRKEDLAGKSVIVIHGYSYGDLAPFLNDAANGVQRSTVGTHKSAFTMLEHGRADYLLDYSGPAEEILAGRPIAGIRSATLADVNVYLVLSRTYPGAEQVMARLEAIAQRLDTKRIMRGPAP
ncbi:MAG: substrate-binding periplasmic protein [Solirubrobacterales bacterium]